ncbi:unnamed protein product [Prorocentrum cordatum]|uniref:Amine oxidase domain-containing protein n=1 Tax=Prorocentrum cordatum TaxID=2364126 RepID=A0ABN9WZT3_9DINO|nr:unnamed protein product [Polarella glacialis]|mmetsp:Transcript_69499/g.193807  ORF Transcript_69499/g.193807 Transcript_69499/m.193807 type:complete len:640 (+) Transcript_69499:116-2035(+)
MALSVLDDRSARTKVAACVAASGVALATGSWLRRLRWSAKQQELNAQAPALPADADLLRVGFSAKKLPKHIDHVIIGSGLSGLYTAALLSKLGRSVVVLEQHYVAGGCTHTFKDKGFEFDTGVHYVGSATQLCAFMDFGAGRRGAFRLQRQGEDDGSEVYNEFHAGGRCVHRYRPGSRTFVEDLAAKYPGDERALRRFFRALRASGSGLGLAAARHFLPAWLWRLLLRLPGPVRLVASRYVQRSFAQAVTDCGIQDGMLRATLSAEFGDHGMVPEEAPFCLQAGVLAHYMSEGGFYPLGGSDAFAQVLVDAIFKNGGRVFVRAPVAKIVVEGGRAVGVDMAGGKGVIRAARSVISSAGAEATYRKLLDDVTVEKVGGVPQSLLETEQGRAISHHVYGFVGFDGTTEELGLPTYNIWSLPTGPGVSDPRDISASWNQLFGSARGELPFFLASDEAAKRAQVPCFMSFPSAKDTTYKERNPGKSVAVLLTESNADFFGEVGPHNKRGEEYATIKRRYEHVFLNSLYHYFPQLKGKATYVDVGTPFSNELYLERKSSYGLSHTSERLLDPTLRISVAGVSGLFLTGQDVLCDGVFPQVLTAWMTVAKVVGVTSPDFWLLFCGFVASVGRRCLFDRTYQSKNP